MAFFRTESWNNILFKDIRKYPVLKGDEEKVRSLIKDINHFLTTH